MTRKTKTTSAKNTQPKRAIDDNYVPPKAPRKPKPEVVSFSDALAEAGQTIEDLLQTPPEDDRPTKPAGTSNLATTIRAYRNQYATVTAPNGKKTQNNGDAVAQALLNTTIAQMNAFVQTKWPGLSYAHLNPGQQRMCLGNRIRGLVKKGDNDALLWLEQQGQPKADDREWVVVEPKAEAEEAPAKPTRKRKPKAAK